MDCLCYNVSYCTTLNTKGMWYVWAFITIHLPQPPPADVARNSWTSHRHTTLPSQPLIRRMKLIFSHWLLLQFSRSLLKSRRKDSWARLSRRRRETAAEDEGGYCFIWLSKPGLIWGLSGEGTCAQAWWKLFRGEKRVEDCIKSLVALIEKPFYLSRQSLFSFFLSLSSAVPLNRIAL